MPRIGADDPDDETARAIALDPFDGQFDLDANASYVRVHFTKDMNASTVNSNTFTIIDSSGNQKGAFAWYDANKKDGYLSFNNDLKAGRTYNVSLSGSIEPPDRASALDGHGQPQRDLAPSARQSHRPQKRLRKERNGRPQREVSGARRPETAAHGKALKGGRPRPTRPPAATCRPPS